MTYPRLKPLNLIGVLLLATMTATSGWAQQPARSVAELQTKFTPDDELKVIDRNGKSTTGRFVSISGSSLTLLVKGARQEFSEATIREIKQRRPHGPKNVLLGAAIGGAAAGVFAGVAHPGADGSNSTTTSVGVLAGAGVGAVGGALKSLFTKNFDTVFITDRGPSVR